MVKRFEMSVMGEMKYFLGLQVNQFSNVIFINLAAAGTEEEQAKNFQWGLRRQRSGDWHHPTSQQSSHRSHGYHNDRHESDRRGIPEIDVTRETGVISPTDLPILVLICNAPLRKEDVMT
nr:hypothetical protein [Tanacetum cinerariifolium]